MRTDIGTRMTSVRGSLSQDEIAKKVGVHKNTWARYERGERSPDADVLLALMDLGIRSDWVLSGEGPMHLADIRPEPVSGWDADLMRQVIEGVEVALEEMDREMAPDAKAKMIVSIYDLYADTGAKPALVKIIKFVKSAA